MKIYLIHTFLTFVVCYFKLKIYNRRGDVVYNVLFCLKFIQLKKEDKTFINNKIKQKNLKIVYRLGIIA